MPHNIATLVQWCESVAAQMHGSTRLIRIRSNIIILKRYTTPKRLLITASVLATTTVMIYLAIFLWPQTITFSYARASCITTPTVFPGLITVQQSRTYNATVTTRTSIAGRAVYSEQICITPKQTPWTDTKEHVYLKGLGGILTKNLTISTTKPPAARVNTADNKPVSARAPLKFTLSSGDIVFGYQLMIDGRTAQCTKDSTRLSCDLASLNLAQSKTYNYSLKRTFNNTAVQTVLAQVLTTVEPVQITSASIAPGQVIYGIPASVTLQLSKPVADVANASLYLVASDGKEQPQPTTNTITGTAATIAFKQPLPRSSKFRIKIDKLESADGGYLASPYTLEFATSGGPKVASINIGTSRVIPQPSITLSFDTNLSPSQSIGAYVSIQTGGNIVPATISANGSKITITLAGPLGRCVPFTVKVADGIQSEFGVSGGSAWQYNARTICQSVFSIGTSVHGRDITAYSFGSGASKVIFVGNTHGNEKSSSYILTDLINYLESNPTIIPANRTVIIIPKLNPDGFAANTRTNAHNVDLNRNFPTSSWKSGVTMPDLTFLANGGGTSALSEPESQAIANFIISQNPRLVLTYHATANIAAPNNSGDSVSLAHTYAQKSPVYFLADDQSPAVFAYDTTGAMEDWLHEKYSIPALLVELNTQTGYEFSGHRPAIQAMIQIP